MTTCFSFPSRKKAKTLALNKYFEINFQIMARKRGFICFQYFISEEMTSKDPRHNTFMGLEWKGKEKYPGTSCPSIICNCTSCAEGMFQLSLKQLCTTPAALKSPENAPWEPRCSLSWNTEDNLSQCVLWMMGWHCQCGVSALLASFTFPQVAGKHIPRH